MIHDIREMRLNAFKNGEKLLHSVLTNVMSDMEKVGKDAGQRLPNPDECIAVVKKHLKGVLDSIKIMEGKVEDHILAMKVYEKEILENLLPKQKTPEELQQMFDVLLPQKLGDWMKHLKEHFNGQYDSQIAKKVFEDNKK